MLHSEKYYIDLEGKSVLVSLILWMIIILLSLCMFGFGLKWLFVGVWGGEIFVGVVFCILFQIVQICRKHDLNCICH